METTEYDSVYYFLDLLPPLNIHMRLVSDQIENFLFQDHQLMISQRNWIHLQMNSI